MKNSYFSAMTVGCLFLGLVFAGAANGITEEVKGWNGIPWETQNPEFATKIGSEAQLLPERKLFKEVFQDYYLASYSFLGFPARVNFLQNRQTTGLCRVELAFLENSGNVFETLEKKLSKAYGIPSQSELPSQSGKTVSKKSCWATPSTRIILSFTIVWPVNSGKVSLDFSSVQGCPDQPELKAPKDENPNVDLIPFSTLSGKEAAEFMLSFRGKDTLTFNTYFYNFLAKGPTEEDLGAFFDTLKFLTPDEYDKLGRFLHSSEVAMEWPGSLGLSVCWHGRGGTSIPVIFLNEAEIAQWANGLADARRAGNGVGHHLPDQLADRLFFGKAKDRFREIYVQAASDPVRILEQKTP